MVVDYNCNGQDCYSTRMQMILLICAGWIGLPAAGIIWCVFAPCICCLMHIAACLLCTEQPSSGQHGFHFGAAYELSIALIWLCFPSVVVVVMSMGAAWYTIEPFWLGIMSSPFVFLALSFVLYRTWRCYYGPTSSWLEYFEGSPSKKDEPTASSPCNEVEQQPSGAYPYNNDQQTPGAYPYNDRNLS